MYNINAETHKNYLKNFARIILYEEEGIRNMVKNLQRLKSISIFLMLLSLLFCVFSFPGYAAPAQSGVEYRISDDGTYIIIIGTAADFPVVNIESEIDGLPVKEIAQSAFQNNTTLYSVTIPDSVEVIGEAAFRNCTNLVSVTLPASLKELPFECFRDCHILSNITLPETLTRIDDQCFYNCTKIGDLKIPASVTEIGHDAFINCESIRLDTSENAYAADYAERYNVNTEFEGTSLYFALMMLLGTAVLLAIVLPIIFIIRRCLKARKNGEH